MTHAILLAAGRGSRLGSLTARIPKPLMHLAERSLLDRSVARLVECGVTKVTVVTGYRADVVVAAIAELPRYGATITIAHNDSWESTGIVRSIVSAGLSELDDHVLIIYGDVVYERKVLDSCLTASQAPRKEGIAIPVNTDWERLWRVRMPDVLSDAESLRLSDEGCLAEIGARVTDLRRVEAQFMGILTIYRDAVGDVLEFLERCLAERERFPLDPDRWDVTTFLAEWMASGRTVQTVAVEGGWLEVDTARDLEIYERLAAVGRLRSYCVLGDAFNE